MAIKMKLIISNSSDLPIYEHIASQIRTLIISGELNEGDALPLMRLLAKELRISVITTKRAYDELEKESFINSFTGSRKYNPKRRAYYENEKGRTKKNSNRCY